jgi:hypothetical protein
VRLTTSHRKILLLRNLNRGGQGPIWAVAPLNEWTKYKAPHCATSSITHFRFTKIKICRSDKKQQPRRNCLQHVFPHEVSCIVTVILLGDGVAQSEE